jgi:peptidase E
LIMKKIFLIGGGEISKKETVKIDRAFIKACGGKKMRLLFFPTAAFDSNGYIKTIANYFIDLGCNNIMWAKISEESIGEIKNKIDWATGIYLGGGSTAELIKAFKKARIIDHFNNSVQSGTVLAGMSAGAMCLGDTSVLSEIKEEPDYGKGFGLIPGQIIVAHYSSIYKEKIIKIKNKLSSQKILAIPERSAVVISGNKISGINKFYKF